ncbi:MAG: proton-conducting transporter membrane subunit, partial [Ktedonobacterales bacterium]
MPVIDMLLTLAGSVPAAAYWLALTLCIIGAALALLLPVARLAYRAAALCAALAGVAALVAGIGALSGFGAPTADIPSALPFGPLLIRLDTLGAFFLLLLGLVGTPIAIFSIGALTAPASERAGSAADATDAAHAEYGSPRGYGFLLCLLLLSLFLIVSAGDAILFIIAWEAMAFLSYLLAIYHDMDRQAARASFVMLAVSEGGTALVIAAFLFLYRASGSFAFADMRLAGPQQSLALRSAIFALTLVGFGAKAGIMPFQFWQTRAYPATNGAFAAVLSAMVMKMAFYGLFRFDLGLLGG